LWQKPVAGAARQPALAGRGLRAGASSFWISRQVFDWAIMARMEATEAAAWAGGKSRRAISSASENLAHALVGSGLLASQAQLLFGLRQLLRHGVGQAEVRQNARLVRRDL
jgi:hypothetical protein